MKYYFVEKCVNQLLLMDPFHSLLDESCIKILKAVFRIRVHFIKIRVWIQGEDFESNPDMTGICLKNCKKNKGFANLQRSKASYYYYYVYRKW